MINFRNNYAAHRALGFSSPVPNFDLALRVAYFYDDWIREVISPDSFYEPSLKESAERLDAMIAPLVDKLIKLTKESQQGTE